MKKFPKDFVNKLYSHKSMTHFYSEQEIDKLKKHWTER